MRASFLNFELVYDDDGEAKEDPRTMDVVGRAELEEALSLNDGEEPPLP